MTSNHSFTAFALKEEARTLMQEILSLTDTHEQENGIDAVDYRAKRDKSRKVLDALEQQGLLMRPSGVSYRRRIL